VKKLYTFTCGSAANQWNASGAIADNRTWLDIPKVVAGSPLNSTVSAGVKTIYLDSTQPYDPVVAFASLGSVPTAGVAKYCTDCTTAATCAGSGTGHRAVSNGTNWTCQ